MDDNTRLQINKCLTDISDGQVSSLEILSCLVSGRMYSVAYSVLHDRILAEDAVQDAFVSIVDNAHRFKPDTNGYAWICKITQNCALNILRKERRRPTVDIDECFFLADPNDPFAKTEATLTLRRALSVLDEREKQAVYYKYFMDQTVRDIAKFTGQSKSAVQRTIDRAEQKMKTFLTDGGTKG